MNNFTFEIKITTLDELESLLTNRDNKKSIIFDFDGVVRRDDKVCILPFSRDIICTGRTISEFVFVANFISKKFIEYNITKTIPTIYCNPITLEVRGDHSEYARTISGFHKLNTIKRLIENKFDIEYIIEDDPLQASIIRGGLLPNNEMADRVILIPKSVEL